jgi:hypothetical protein
VVKTRLQIAPTVRANARIKQQAFSGTLVSRSGVVICAFEVVVVAHLADWVSAVSLQQDIGIIT